MSDLNNIDKLLKDNFVDFTPDAPDVWQGIQQGVQAAKAAQTAETATAVKGAGLAVKVIGAIVIGAAAVTGYVLLSTDRSSSPVIPTQQTTTATNENVTTELPEISTSQPISEATQPSRMAKTAAPKTQTPGGDKPQHSQQSNAIELPEQHPVSIELKDQPQKDIAAEEKVLESTLTPPVSKEQLVKEPQEKIVPKPYNPNEELDEAGKPTIPNTFSPNGDGLNDRFVILIENEQFYSLMILDKNGNLVFESNDKNNTWDGKDYKSGAICPAGTYYMVFRYQLKGSASERRTTGKIVVFN